MCLAIAARQGVRIPDAHIEAGVRSQRSGSGYAFVRDGKVIIKKGYFTADKLIEDYSRDFKDYPDSAWLMHMRTSTRGKVDTDNCHPFRGKYGAFVHNGHVSGLGDREISDTRELAQLMFNAPERALPRIITNVLEKESGWSLFAFLTNSNQLLFANEHQGHWNEGVWYSNSCYKTGQTDRGGSSRTAALYEDYDPWRGLDD